MVKKHRIALNIAFHAPGIWPKRRGGGLYSIPTTSLTLFMTFSAPPAMLLHK